jgi:hypothetical protein
MFHLIVGAAGVFEGLQPNERRQTATTWTLLMMFVMNRMPGMSRAWKRERSGRCRALAACIDWAEASIH